MDGLLVILQGESVLPQDGITLEFDDTNIWLKVRITIEVFSTLVTE